MFDDDASEEEREDLFLDTEERKNTKSRESRKEREEKLKRMMEDGG
jgi:DNA polymerase delta subunit 3